MPTEQWKPILEFPKYAISNLGRVKRTSPGTNRRKSGYLLKLCKAKGGYLRVDLCGNGVVKHRLIHHLVLEYFVKNRPSPIHQSNHINGEKRDNRPNNLEWLTLKENRAHATRMGLVASGKKHGSYTHPECTPRGSNHPNSKLTEEIVKYIRTSPKRYGLPTKLAKRFSVTPTLIRLIQKGSGWKHVKTQNGRN